MNVQEHILKITGGTYIDHELNPEKTQKIVGELNIYSREFKENEDGTQTLVYKSKFVGAVALSEGDGVIISRDRGSSSKRLRLELMKIHDSMESKVEFDDWYKAFMNKLIAFLPDTMAFLKEKTEL